MVVVQICAFSLSGLVFSSRDGGYLLAERMGGETCCDAIRSYLVMKRPAGFDRYTFHLGLGIEFALSEWWLMRNL